MNPIEQFRDDWQNAKERLLAAQRDCPHDNVLHEAGFTSYGTYHPQRICTNCGVIETGGWWCYTVNCSHWHAKDRYGHAILGSRDGRTITEVSNAEFSKYRTGV